MKITPFAGLFQLESGEPIATDDYAFYDNVAIIDNYLMWVGTHEHNDADAVQPFDDSPSATPSSDDGFLLGNTTWWIGITAVDQYGGETVATTASAAIPGVLEDPTVAPTLNALAGGGSFTAGTYRYSYTLVSGSGETLPSPIEDVTVFTGGRIQITPPGAPSEWRLYRSYGFSDLERVGDTHTASSIIDDGTDPTLYCGQHAPDENTTGGTGSIYVSRPAMPSGAVGWRVYASPEEDLVSPSLVEYDNEGALPFEDTIPAAASAILFEDDSLITTGEPPPVNRTLPGGAPLFAANIIYDGAPGLASGNVEDALDALSARVVSLNGASGDLALYGSGNVSVALTGSAIVITGTGGGASAGVSSISASGESPLTGDVVLVAGSNVTLNQGAGYIEIEAAASGGSGQSYMNDLLDVASGGLASGDVYTWNGDDTFIPQQISHTFETTHSWGVASAVRVPSGEQDVITPMKFHLDGAHHTAKLVSVDYKHTTADASATFSVMKNGAGATGFTGLVANDSWQETDPTDVALADGDVLAPEVTSIGGTPRNLSVSIVIEHTVVKT